MTDKPSRPRSPQAIGRPPEATGAPRSELAAQAIGERLRRALQVGGIAQAVGASSDATSLPQMIMEHAARLIGARSASMFRLDEVEDVLVIDYALGPKAAEVLNLRVPVGHGVSGLTAATGQALAVSNAQHDSRHAADIADKVGYWPDSILCAPLLLGDRVIGVLELLDKEGAPSFTAADLETLGLFANQAALAMVHESATRALRLLVIEAVGPLVAEPSDGAADSANDIRALAESIERDPIYRQGLEAARAIQAISERGENELNASIALLKSFAHYLESVPQPTADLWSPA